MRIKSYLQLYSFEKDKLSEIQPGTILRFDGFIAVVQNSKPDLSRDLLEQFALNIVERLDFPPLLESMMVEAIFYPNPYMMADAVTQIASIPAVEIPKNWSGSCDCVQCALAKKLVELDQSRIIDLIPPKQSRKKPTPGYPLASQDSPEDSAISKLIAEIDSLSN